MACFNLSKNFLSTNVEKKTIQVKNYFNKITEANYIFLQFQ